MSISHEALLIAGLEYDDFVEERSKYDKVIRYDGITGKPYEKEIKSYVYRLGKVYNGPDLESPPDELDINQIGLGLFKGHSEENDKVIGLLVGTVDPTYYSDISDEEINEIKKKVFDILFQYGYSFDEIKLFLMLRVG